jgi:hypothetical protein
MTTKKKKKKTKKAIPKNKHTAHIVSEGKSATLSRKAFDKVDLTAVEPVLESTLTILRVSQKESANESITSL